METYQVLALVAHRSCKPIICEYCYQSTGHPYAMDRALRSGCSLCTLMYPHLLDFTVIFLKKSGTFCPKSDKVRLREKVVFPTHC